MRSTRRCVAASGCLWIASCLLMAPSEVGAQEFGDTDAGRVLPPLLQQDPSALWAALQDLRPRFEGDPVFDMLLARTALATDHREDARLALERVRFIAPEMAGARSLLLAMQTEAASTAAAAPVSAAWQAPRVAAESDPAGLLALKATLGERA